MRARLGHHLVPHSEIEQAARRRDALAELEIELGLPERRGHLVLDNLHPHTVTDSLATAVLEGLNTANVQPLRGVELQRTPTRLSLRRAVHHADLFADLVGEEAQRLRAVQVTRELAHRQRHHPCLRAHRLIAHLPLELLARRQRRDRIDRDHIDGAGAHEHVGDLQRLLAVVGLGDEQLIDIDPDLAGIQRVHRVLGVDERAHATQRLSLCQHVIDERRLTRGLRTVDLHDPPPRHPADPERQIQRQRTRGDRFTLHLRAGFAHAHQRALAELPLDVLERATQGNLPGHSGVLPVGEGYGGHL
jgi:hypothetical protein